MVPKLQKGFEGKTVGRKTLILIYVTDDLETSSQTYTLFMVKFLWLREPDGHKSRKKNR